MCSYISSEAGTHQRCVTWELSCQQCRGKGMGRTHLQTPGQIFSPVCGKLPSICCELSCQAPGDKPGLPAGCFLQHRVAWSGRASAPSWRVLGAFKYSAVSVSSQSVSLAKQVMLYLTEREGENNKHLSRTQGNCINPSKCFSLWCLMEQQLRMKCQLRSSIGVPDARIVTPHISFFVALTFSSQRSLGCLSHTRLPQTSAQEHVELEFLGRVCSCSCFP